MSLQPTPPPTLHSCAPCPHCGALVAVRVWQAGGLTPGWVALAQPVSPVLGEAHTCGEAGQEATP
jgi:hypothetical protein